MSSFCYSNYGATFRCVKSTYSVEDGEVLFDSAPTTAELISAFPATQGTIPLTVTAIAATGDVIEVQDVSLTAGTDFDVATTIATTVTNIITALNDSDDFNANYIAVADDDDTAVINVNERCAGIGLTPSEATVTQADSGTLAVTSGTATTSVWGYTTQIKHQEKIALENEADIILDEYKSSYILALAESDSTTAATLATAISDLKTELYEAKRSVDIESIS